MREDTFIIPDRQLRQMQEINCCVKHKNYQSLSEVFEADD